MTVNISLPLDFFSIDFPTANRTRKSTRSTTKPKATKGYTYTQYAQCIHYSFKTSNVDLFMLFTNRLMVQQFFCIIYSEKSLGLQGLSTYPQRRQGPQRSFGQVPPTRSPL